MKSEYPKKGSYSHGELLVLESTLSINNKKILYDFLEHCATSAGKSKLDKIKRVILQLYDVTETNLNELDKKTITSFLALLNLSDRKGWSKHEIKVYVKKFLKWYYKDLELLELIKTNSRDKDVVVSENDLITEQEFDKIIESCDNIRKKALFTVCWESGARPEEILNLKWKDISFEDNVALLSFHSNKTNKTRTFPVKRAKEFLWHYKQQWLFPKLKGEDYVFVTPENRNSRISTIAANKLLRKAAIKAGIEKNVWMYIFRHSRATKLYEELPQQIVEKLLGHKDMAKIYAHISNKKANDVLISKIYQVNPLPINERDNMQRQIDELKKLNFLSIKYFELNQSLINGSITKEQYAKDYERLGKNINTQLKKVTVDKTP